MNATTVTTVMRAQLRSAADLPADWHRLAWEHANSPARDDYERGARAGLAADLAGRLDAPADLRAQYAITKTTLVRQAFLARADLTSAELTHALAGEKRAAVLTALLEARRTDPIVLDGVGAAFLTKPTATLAAALIEVDPALVRHDVGEAVLELMCTRTGLTSGQHYRLDQWEKAKSGHLFRPCEQTLHSFDDPIAAVAAMGRQERITAADQATDPGLLAALVTYADTALLSDGQAQLAEALAHNTSCTDPAQLLTVLDILDRSHPTASPVRGIWEVAARSTDPAVLAAALTVDAPSALGAGNPAGVPEQMMCAVITKLAEAASLTDWSRRETTARRRTQNPYAGVTGLAALATDPRVPAAALREIPWPIVHKWARELPYIHLAGTGEHPYLGQMWTLLTGLQVQVLSHGQDCWQTYTQLAETFTGTVGDLFTSALAVSAD